MNAFETELGVMTELAQAVNDMGWLLPTDIQGEAIPLILGGGDVLMAAETGSGKTGAFCLPVLQIVYETLKDIQEHKGMGKSADNTSKPKAPIGFKMSAFDRTAAIAIDPEGLLCQSRDENQWHGCRCTRGVANKGKYYYEARVVDEGLCRVGWSTQDAVLDLGTDRLGFGFGGTGKKSFGKQFDSYGESYGKNDVIGCYLDLDNMKIKWAKNGKVFDNAYDIQSGLRNYAFFPAVCMKNAEILFNFGETPFDFPPKDGFIGISQASKEFTVVSPRSSSAITRGSLKRENNAPLALIMEPSKELAEQTLKQIETFKRHMSNPAIKELLIVGGLPVKDQIAVLEHRGCDIVVATPGRLEDFVNTKKLSLEQVRFLVLDEVDGLLTQGHRDMIMRLHREIPAVSVEGKRLQVIVCSATLHNFEVKKLADAIMHFPTWVDLKGQDSVPDTIHHCVCIIDPKVDTSWRNLRRHVQTDGVHATDRLNYHNESKEMLSEAVKLLKAEYCIRAIEKYKMDKALIFCRTKLDCDNLENYFISLGGGPRPRDPNHQFSCVCLHADRNQNERTENLERFKQNKVKFLICTDVAARGLDIGGLPYVINVTLPDEKQNYVHRIGRVGRADRMGLAISFAAKVQEKVWYHSCPSKGKNCANRLLKDEGGCCIWYNEMYYLDEIEEHLGCTIPQIPSTLEVPINEFDGKVIYGEKKKAKGNLFKGHVDQLAPTVDQLLNLEKKIQINYLNMMFGAQKTQ